MLNLNDSVLKKDVNAVKAALAAGEDINTTDRGGRTPLMNAVIDTLVEIAEILLKAGANPNLKDKGGWSALHFASQSQSLDLVKLLAQYNAEINSIDDYGNTPLFRAVFRSRGDGTIIKELLRLGADRDIENKHGVSPLKLANTIANYNVRQFFE